MKITITDHWLKSEFENVPVGVAEVIAKLLNNLAKSLDIVEEIRDLREEAYKEETIDEKYHTCGRCKYGDTFPYGYPCSECVHGFDNREDYWELAESEE